MRRSSALCVTNVTACMARRAEGCSRSSHFVKIPTHTSLYADLSGGCSSTVRAPGCGPGGCGFETRHSPQPGLHFIERVSRLPSKGSCAIRLRKTVDPFMRSASDDPLLRAFEKGLFLFRGTTSDSEESKRYQPSFGTCDDRSFIKTKPRDAAMASAFLCDDEPKPALSFASLLKVQEMKWSKPRTAEWASICTSATYPVFS